MSQEAAPDSDEMISRPGVEGESPGGLRRKLVRALLFPFRLAARLRRVENLVHNHEQGLAGQQGQLDGLETRAGEGSARLDHIDRVLGELRSGIDSLLGEGARMDQAEGAIRTLQAEMETLRDDFAPMVERRLDQAESDLRAVNDEVGRLRDELVPAAVARGDLLIDRLTEELEEVGSLVERMLRSEPLPVPPSGTPDEASLARELTAVQPILVDRFRGGEEEIRHRLDRYLAELREQAPVLDLGSGRGELLLLLREAGVEAVGIEGDPALAQAARRRGLQLIEGRLPAALSELESDGWGAVTAIHLMEHLDPGALLVTLREVRRVLRPGGLVLVESPNPHSLRVWSGLYWVDPTHRRPLPPETVQVFLEASGFEVEGVELLHPFPEEQCLACAPSELAEGMGPGVAELYDQLDQLRRRLDDIINGPRDFVVRARKPVAEESP